MLVDQSVGDLAKRMVAKMEQRLVAELVAESVAESVGWKELSRGLKRVGSKGYY